MAVKEYENEGKVYLLPSLMTAGNLLCGFLAILKILEGSTLRDSELSGWIHTYKTSLDFILAAFVFDLLDGRVARLGGKESAFGREFDSLADLISFGVAPALLVFEIVLYQFPHRLGWIVAATYLVCGALRLARFNVHAARAEDSKEVFTGFPIPAAAGLVSSLTLFLLSLYETDRELKQGWGRYVLAGLLLLLSFMMFSKLRYPSFKGVGLRTQHSMPKFLLVLAMAALTIVYYKWMLAIDFLAYFLFGIIRPLLSAHWRRTLEEETEERESPSE